MKRFLLVISLSMISLSATALETVRVGVLNFGTVNWELDVVRQHGFDKANGIELQVIPLSSKNAVSVALQGGAVDLIVSDWIWVNRQRAAGKAYTFFPYSLTVGGAYVHPASGISDLTGLKDRKLGIAGGPVDKSWLLLQAYARRQGIALADEIEPTFAAPPLLNQLMLKGELPAVLNFWHYGARLEARGMQPLIDVKAMLSGLGIHDPVPMLGWVYSDGWADENPAAIIGFLKASYQAKKVLRKSDAEWQRIAPLTKAKNDSTLHNLRDGYRRGVPVGLDRNGQPVATRVFAVLQREGGKKLVGDAASLLPGTFWQGLDSRELIERDAAR